jgi:hypothetical protein
MLVIESALLVLVPEAEIVVRSFRDKYDPSAAYGCPAHVGLLYPFKPPDEIRQTDYDSLSRCFAPFEPFPVLSCGNSTFPGRLIFRAGAG